jgi:hypothetical protein
MLSPWKRVAAAAGFGIGGGGGSWWGFHDIAVFVRALSDNAPIVETQSAMPGLPLMGIALMAISALFLLPADATTRFRLLQERLVVGILVTLVVSASLSLAGSPIIHAVMQTYDYHSCAVKHGRRMTFVTWAAQGVSCPPEQVDR